MNLFPGNSSVSWLKSLVRIRPLAKNFLFKILRKLIFHESTIPDSCQITRHSVFAAKKILTKASTLAIVEALNGGTGAVTASPQNGNGPGVVVGGIMSRNRTIALILAISATLSQANAASFQGVGGLSDHAFVLSEGLGVSGDGSVAFGSSMISDGWEAFRWTAEIGIQSLGDLPGGQVGGYPLGSSYDGSVIVGSSYTNNSSGNPVERAYAWTQQAGMEELPLPDTYSNDYYASAAFSISADGRMITGLVGLGYSVFGNTQVNKAVIWDIENDATTLIDWPDNTVSDPRFQGIDISADASTVLINGAPDDFMWTQEDGYTETVAGAMALSGDGSTIMGGGRFGDEHRYDAFIWTEQGGHQYIGAVDGWISNQGSDISYDGSTVVGCLLNNPIQYEDFAAYIWNEQDGVRLIQDILAGDYNLDLTGWTLRSATGISDDGLTIVGNGINPDGIEEGWIATIPEPATIILFALGGVILRRTRYA